MQKSTRSSIERDIFVDTSGFYALVVKGDRMHGRAKDLLARAAKTARRFVTTDYVLDETATLLRSRAYGSLVDAVFHTVFSSAACRVEWMDPERFERVRRFFLKHQDKEWSFTDSFSFWLMRQLSLNAALTTDQHFRQAGFEALLL